MSISKIKHFFYFTKKSYRLKDIQKFNREKIKFNSNALNIKLIVSIVKTNNKKKNK